MKSLLFDASENHPRLDVPGMIIRWEKTPSPEFAASHRPATILASWKLSDKQISKLSTPPENQIEVIVQSEVDGETLTKFISPARDPVRGPVKISPGGTIAGFFSVDLFELYEELVPRRWKVKVRIGDSIESNVLILNREKK